MPLKEKTSDLSNCCSSRRRFPTPGKFTMNLMRPRQEQVAGDGQLKAVHTTFILTAVIQLCTSSKEAHSLGSGTAPSCSPAQA